MDTRAHRVALGIMVAPLIVVVSALVGAFFLWANTAEAQTISWTPVNNGFNLMAFTASDLATDGTNIFASTEYNPSGVAKSVNDGNLWTTVTSSANGFAVNSGVSSLAAAGTNAFIATFGNGIFRSTDGGATWTHFDSGLSGVSVYSLVISGTDIFAGTTNGVFKSTVDVNSWTNFGLTGKAIPSLAVQGSNIFAGTESSGVWRSDVTTSSWTNVGLGTDYIRTIAADGANVFAGTFGNGVWQSTDSGSSWTNSRTGIGSNLIFSLATNGTDVFAGTYGNGVFQSPVNGSTWTQAGLPGRQVLSLLVKGSYLFAGTSDTAVYRASLTPPNLPPVITFTETPENPTGMPYARFQFTASDDMTPVADLWFECRLDGGSFSFCVSPHIVDGLGIGSHTFEVRTQDAEGNISVASFSWTVQVMPTKLRTEDCGASTNTLATFIYADPVASATNYQWEFTHAASGFSKTIQRGFGLNNFHLTWVSGIQYGKTYDVRIKPLIGGVWQNYGQTCQFTVLGPIPSPKLRDADSGLTTNSLNQFLFTDLVAGAQNYQWEFTHAASAFQKAISRGSSSLNFILGWVPDITYGKTYDIRIKASVGGVWGDFGPVRQVTLAYPLPLTKVRTTDCGITLNSLSQNIFNDAAPGATNYEWEVSNTNLGYSTTFLRNSTATNFQLGWLAGIEYGITYNIRVRGKMAGEWAEYGFVCQVTTPAAPGINDTDTDGIDNAVDTQPNAFSNDFSDVALGGTTSGTISTRGGRSWYVYDEGSPKGVHVVVSSGASAAEVVGTGACVPQTSNTIPANTGAGFILTCGSVETEVYDGEVISSATSGGASASVSITPRNTLRFSSPQAGTIVVRLDTDELNGLELTANDGTHELLPGEPIAVGESGILSLPVVTPAISGVQGTGGWYLSDVAVDFRVSADTEFTTQGCESGTVTADTSGMAFPCIATSAEGVTDGTVTIKRDTVAPGTTLTESSEGSAPWFRKSTITLSGTDATSGIARIEYRLDGSAWTVYDAPIVLEDGEHTVAYRSVDNAGNVEAERSITRSVDGTPPELSAQCVLSEEALAVAGSDAGSGVSSATLTNTERVKEWKFKERRTYTVADAAGNSLEARFGVKAGGHESAFSLLTLSYNGMPAALPSNDVKCEWSGKADTVKELEQKLTVGKGKSASAAEGKFEGKKNETKITLKTRGEEKQRVTLPGLVFLKLISSVGELKVEY